MSAPIRTLSPDRRELWVERIFARMAAMYGRLFADMWAGADLAEVKAAWADDLGPFGGAQIAWAMEQCKTRELPPTLPGFRNLCQQAPRPEALALPAPKVPHDVAQQRAQELRRNAEKIAGRRVDGAAWARMPPAGGARGTPWEKAVIELAESGDVRFIEILAEHVDRGVIVSARASAAVTGGGAGGDFH